MKIEQKTITIDISNDVAEPTRVCLICECKENPLSNYVYTDKTWLCDKCRAALLKVVKETEKGGE